MTTDVLKQLDERILAFVNRMNQLHRDNEQLTQRLAESEKRLKEAAGQLKQLETEHQQHENERTEVRTRIEKILARFDGINLK
ncbi:MAG: cell division protein ZapB [Candidatus Binataceae bacterium]